MLSYLYLYLRSLLAPVRDERGADLAEYALLLALIAIIVIAALMILGPTIANVFNLISAHLGNVS